MSTLWTFHVLSAWYGPTSEPTMADNRLTIVDHARGVNLDGRKVLVSGFEPESAG